VWSFLLVVNASKLDLPLVWSLHLGGFVALAVSLVIAGVVTNVRVFRAIERTLPPWFDPRLRDVILRKSRANALSHRLQHYVIKPFTPKMINERVAWQDIEAMVARIPFAEGFDTIIGITSGGAFIARCVAARLGTQDVQYVQSRLWSRMPLHKNLAASFRYYVGRTNDTRVGFLGGDVDLSGKRVLLVDDSVCTGATLASVERFCRARGAAYVKTLALFVDPRHPTDYFFRMSKTPLVWPWGWESD
jgi:hypoxanthine phosphoribosyltransferase